MDHLIILLFFLLVGINNTEVPQYRLHTHFKLADLYDEVSKNYASMHCTQFGLYWVENRHQDKNKAVEFLDNYNCYMRKNNVPFMPGDKPFSFSFWINLPQFPNCEHIMTTSQQVYYGLGVRICNTEMRFVVGNGNNYDEFIYTGIGSMTANQWHFIVVNRNDKGELEVYIDNEIKATGSYTGSYADGSYLESGIFIGRHPKMGGTVTFRLSDFIAYTDRILFPQEIEALYLDSFDYGVIINYPFERYNLTHMSEVGGNYYIAETLNSVFTEDRFHQKDKAGYCDGKNTFNCSFFFLPNIDHDISRLSFSMTEFSISFWIKYEQIPIPGEKFVIFKTHGENFLRLKITIEGNPLEVEYLRFVQNYNEFIIQAKYVPPGVWNHIALTFDGSGVNLYINRHVLGNYDYTTFFSFELGWEFGKCTSRCDTSDKILHGSIDDFIVYDRLLTYSDVSNIYFSNNKFINGLIAHFPFNKNVDDMTEFKHKIIVTSVTGRDLYVGKKLFIDPSITISIQDSHVFNFDRPNQKSSEGSFSISFVINFQELDNGYILSSSNLENHGFSIKYHYEKIFVKIGKEEIEVVFKEKINKYQDYHMVLIKEDSEIRLYVNGNVVHSHTIFYGMILNVDYFRSGINIGFHENYPNERITAYLSELKIFNMPLSYKDVQDLLHEVNIDVPFRLEYFIIGLLSVMFTLVCPLIIIICCILIFLMCCFIIGKPGNKDKGENIDNEIEKKRRELMILEEKKRKSVSTPNQAVLIQPNIINPHQVQPQFQPQVQQMDQSTSKEPVEYIANVPSEFDNQAIY